MVRLAWEGACGGRVYGLRGHLGRNVGRGPPSKVIYRGVETHGGMGDEREEEREPRKERKRKNHRWGCDLGKRDMGKRTRKQSE